MATREIRESRARELIAQQQEAGRRKIAAQLRQEGLGLRDATILRLQREAYPERRRVIVQPYQLARPVEKRYKPVRRSRYNKLVKMNFSASEARKLSTLPLTQLPFIKDMAKSRKELVAGMLVGWSKTRAKTELIALIDFTYNDRGWADREGIHNPYSMVRHFRREAIDAGLWDPKDSPWRKKPSIRKKMFSSRWRGDTVGQKTRYRKLHRETITQARVDYRQRQRDKAHR